MAIYKKKPIVIEAFQLTEKSRNNAHNWPHWAFEAWNKERAAPNALYPTEIGGVALSIMTLEGEMSASINDYIIQGIKGELYPCKPDIFEASYDLVEE